MEISDAEFHLLSKMAAGLVDHRFMDLTVLRSLVRKQLAFDLPDHQATVITPDGVRAFAKIRLERSLKQAPGGN